MILYAKFRFIWSKFTSILHQFTEFDYWIGFTAVVRANENTSGWVLWIKNMFSSARKRDKLESLFEVRRGWFSNERRSYLRCAWLDLIARAHCLNCCQRRYSSKCARHIYGGGFGMSYPWCGFKVLQLVDRWINGWKTICCLICSMEFGCS